MPLTELLQFSKTYKEHLSNYTKTRDEYMAKYRAFPLALKLEEEQKVVVIQQEREKEIGEKKNSIAEQISTLEGKEFIILQSFFK